LNVTVRLTAQLATPATTHRTQLEWYGSPADAWQLFI